MGKIKVTCECDSVLSVKPAAPDLERGRSATAMPADTETGYDAWRRAGRRVEDVYKFKALRLRPGDEAVISGLKSERAQKYNGTKCKLVDQSDATHWQVKCTMVERRECHRSVCA